jgi:hypothetical protein
MRRGLGACVATALMFRPNGELVLGGSFGVVVGQGSAFLARRVPACPALVAPAGAGCARSGGANELSVVELAWLGGTCRTRGTGLPAVAVVSIVNGFAPASIPLAAVLPLATPDFVTFAVATAGTVETAVAIPATPAVIGATFWQQLNPFELDAALQIVAVTATNALRFTVGVP